MTQSELIILNFTEIRRRSIKLWSVLPESHYHWKPDEEAMTAIEMVRHVLEADYGWDMIINKGSMANYRTPWQGRALGSVSGELEFAQPYRDAFLESVRQFSDKDLSEGYVIHPGNGEQKALGKYLLRIGYHESVHAGQFLAYLRAMNIERPRIWD
ncbi:DinB family protein [Phaeodactylibacter luteus]|uniref:DinB family protein n=1 Tax=Phaeodactylibacter luteus TaxID=1564516 RepID=A0A5C6RHA8_9BACT|nr:DinB family protein [Phaeodactylibacter luteus]TXB61838.1 DinB family protein [Phaeodactylibacter luteus]